MTKTESAHLTAKTLLLESAEQVLQLHSGAGVRLAIPDTEALIMVGPADWIAKNVPGVEAMVANAETKLDAPEFMALLGEFYEQASCEEFNESAYNATRAAVLARLAATTQASTAQAERVPDGFVLMPKRLTPEMKQAGGHANSEWLNDNAPIGEARYAMPMESIYAALCAAAPAATSSTDSALAAQARDAALEEAANALDLMNDSASDAADHENREMYCCEDAKMWTLNHAAAAIRALRSATATGSGDE